MLIVCISKIAAARVQQDDVIVHKFLQPWQRTLTSGIAVALKARQAVSTSRLELDAAKQAFKTAGPARQEQARLEVENAEDDLVQKTEVAITLMKTVLDNVSNKNYPVTLTDNLCFSPRQSRI